MNSLEDLVDFIKTGANNELKEAVSNNPSLAEIKTEQGISLLQFSIYCRNREAAEILRNYKKEIDLFEAVSLGDYQMVETYLTRKPDLINTFAIDGFSPLGLASFFEHKKLVGLFLDREASPNVPANNSFKVTPLHSACAVSNFEIAEILIKKGADVNAKQMSGVTPLHSAAHNGQTKLAKLLIENGADVNAKMEDGKTPLLMAEEINNNETIELLKNSGAE